MMDKNNMAFAIGYKAFPLSDNRINAINVEKTYKWRKRKCRDYKTLPEIIIL